MANDNKIEKTKTTKKVAKDGNDNLKSKKKEKDLTENISNKKDQKSLKSLEKLDDNRKIIVAFVIGFLISTLLFRCILWPDRIATLKDGTQPIAKFKETVITADDLYYDLKDAKKIDSFNILLNQIDKKILEKKYPINEEIKKEVRELADRYYMVYEQQLGYTKEQTIQYNGASSEEDFLNKLTLDHLRMLYVEDYVNDLIEDEDINKYYKDEVFGDVDTKHILVAVKKNDDEDGLSNEEAKKLSEEIIKKLDNGTSWDDVIKEYDKQIVSEKLGFQPFNARLEENYLKEMRDLKVDSYSKKPVLTSYGYHIVYKVAEKNKPELKDVKDDIIEAIAAQIKESDNNIGSKALIKMRKDVNLEFVDTKFNEQYNAIVNSIK